MPDKPRGTAAAESTRAGELDRLQRPGCVALKLCGKLPCAPAKNLERSARQIGSRPAAAWGHGDARRRESPVRRAIQAAARIACCASGARLCREGILGRDSWGPRSL